MSQQNPLFLQKTVLDVQIVYQNVQMQSPVPLNSGNGVSSCMEVDAPDNIQYDMTTTGDVSVALLPVDVSGKITLAPQSPAIQSLQQANTNYAIDDIIIPGVITVSSASGGWSYQFNNVVISSPFHGYTLNKVVEDYVFNFKATLPKVTTLTNIINSAAGLVNLA